MSYNPVPVPDGSVTAVKLADGSVGTAKLADAAVNTDKMNIATLAKTLLVQTTTDDAKNTLDVRDNAVVPFTF